MNAFIESIPSWKEFMSVLHRYSPAFTNTSFGFLPGYRDLLFPEPLHRYLEIRRRANRDLFRSNGGAESAGGERKRRFSGWHHRNIHLEKRTMGILRKLQFRKSFKNGLSVPVKKAYDQVMNTNIFVLNILVILYIP